MCSSVDSRRSPPFQRLFDSPPHKVPVALVDLTPLVQLLSTPPYSVLSRRPRKHHHHHKTTLDDDVKHSITNISSISIIDLTATAALPICPPEPSCVVDRLGLGLDITTPVAVAIIDILSTGLIPPSLSAPLQSPGVVAGFLCRRRQSLADSHCHDWHVAPTSKTY